MVEVLQVSPASLDRSIASGVHALLAVAFPEDSVAEGGYYNAHGTPSVVLILHDGPQVIGHLGLYERQVIMGHEPILIGMLGGIVVAPERRRNGHCRVLVLHAHEHLQRRNIPFSILFAHEPPVYRSSGYELMQNETRFIDVEGKAKAFVFRGSMYAELLQRRWPNQLLDLRGGVV